MEPSFKHTNEIPILSESYCGLCGIETTNLCGKCFVFSYCCPQHQKLDWVRHQVSCGKTLSVPVEPIEEFLEESKDQEPNAKSIKNQKKKLRLKRLK